MLSPQHLVMGAPPQIIVEPDAIMDGYQYWSTGADPRGVKDCGELDENGCEYVEIAFPQEYHKLIMDNPPPAGMLATLRVYTTNNVKRSVVVRDNDDLSPEEFRTHKDAVAAAVKEELQVWIDHQCFTRRPRNWRPRRSRCEMGWQMEMGEETG